MTKVRVTITSEEGEVLETYTVVSDQPEYNAPSALAWSIRFNTEGEVEEDQADGVKVFP